jgi:hypothetical protein
MHREACQRVAGYRFYCPQGESQWVLPGLDARSDVTTISQSQQKLGHRRVEMILERLPGEMQGPGRCEEIRFELLVGQSA